jgi:hypothetical protein
MQPPGHRKPISRSLPGSRNDLMTMRKPSLMAAGTGRREQVSCMNRIELTVTINGTDMNPWHLFGLRQNPFPQTGKAEYAAGERKLASLDGDPVRTADDIRERLAGFDPEFVEGVIQRWQPGRRVRFKIAFPDGHNTAEPSGELSVGDVVAVTADCEVRLAVAKTGWAPVAGPLTGVRTREYGTHPLPMPAPITDSARPDPDETLSEGDRP